MPEEVAGPDGSDPTQTHVQPKTDIGPSISDLKPASKFDVLLGGKVLSKPSHSLELTSCRDEGKYAHFATEKKT
jgi:hypothetical protein